MQRGYLDRPGCRLYYEVDGGGPFLFFAHGLGGNHLSWWQQVPHFRERYTCVTFAHRGFAPSSAPPGGPDPNEYAGDLAALVDHLGARDMRIVAQSMGGWTALEYALAQPERVRALVLACTAGTIARAPSLFADADQLPAWERKAAAAAKELQAANIHVAGGERFAREQPAAHFLYQEIDALSGVDKVNLRQKLYDSLVRPADALRTLSVPTLWITGDEDMVYPPFLSEILAKLMPNARVVQVKQSGHSVYFERAAEFNRIVDKFLTANR
ncbi:MAG: alpha/beta hydrolase [Xanthobacteraceae bacterium]